MHDGTLPVQSTITYQTKPRLVTYAFDGTLGHKNANVQGNHVVGSFTC